MLNCHRDFGPFDGKIWLNTASEGPLPHAAVKALDEAIDWKLKPFYLTAPKFTSVPYHLKKTIGRLINVAHDDIILGNSASYGLHLLANGLPFTAGDEILLMQNDFPVNILPWLDLSRKGVLVRQLPAKNHVLQSEELLKSMTPRTRVVCLSYVHTFTGHKIDPIAIGNLCRDRGVIFILNCSQAIGTMPMDLSRLPVDAITCAGYKWLCGPYATGFCWMTPKIRESLELNMAYWSALLGEEQLHTTEELTLPKGKQARRFDVFATANFFNYVPWQASMEYLLNIGIENIASHNQQLIDQLIRGLEKKFNLISPWELPRRSNIVVFSDKDPEQNQVIFEFLKEKGVYLALWKGNLRVSPHVFNTTEEIVQFLSILNSFSAGPAKSAI